MIRRIAILTIGLAWSAAACSSAASTPTPAPTASATPTPLPSVEQTPVPTTSVPLRPLPAGYERVVSIVEYYALAVPPDWVYLISQGSEFVPTQVRRLEARYPQLTPLIEAQKDLVGGKVKLVMFDPSAASPPQVMLGRLEEGDPVSPESLPVVQKALEEELAGTGLAEAISSEIVDLPPGPAIRLHYRATMMGQTIRAVQYVIPGANHSRVITFVASSEIFGDYEQTFAQVAATFQDLYAPS